MAGAAKIILLLLILIGIILLMVAKIYMAQLITGDYDYDSDEPDQIQYNTTIMQAIAIALISMGLIIGALMIEDLGNATRSGLAIAAGIVIALTSLSLL